MGARGDLEASASERLLPGRAKSWFTEAMFLHYHGHTCIYVHTYSYVCVLMHVDVNAYVCADMQVDCKLVG